MRIIKLHEHGLVGTLFQPHSQTKLPGIILVPGSDGGIPEAFAEKLALENYCVLALGYFALENLPENLEYIPLEYFLKAFAWFKNQECINNTITLIGYSRGGELALLLGSFFPDLMAAIIAYAPGSAVCGGFPHPNSPAWLYANKPITPFISGLTSDDSDLTEGQDLLLATQSGTIPFHANTEDDPYEISELFLARQQKNNILQLAAIPVEKISCPLLILSGEDDKIWPSTLYSNLIMDRLDQTESSIKRQHLSYPNAGHSLIAPYDQAIFHPVGKFWCKLGGTPEGNAYAKKASWQTLLEFLSPE